MKITTKIKLMIIPLVLLPFVAIFGAVYFFGNSYLSTIYGRGMGLSLENNYANPILTMNVMNQDVFTRIRSTAIEDAAKFEEEAFLEELNNELIFNNSYLLIRKDNQIIYMGDETNPAGKDLKLPEYGTSSGSMDGGIFINSPEPIYIRQQDFLFRDGSKGSVFLVSYAKDMLLNFRKRLWDMLLSVAVVLVVSGVCISAYLHRAFLCPIRLLQEGTNRIKEGDLESDVEIIHNDEIGDLCISFNEMREKLKQSIDARLHYEEENRELISNISHDLKTPITAIKGYVEGIMDGVADTPEKMDRYIRTIYTKANEMDVLINELSLYSKIDNNAIPYDFKKVSLADYFEDCIEDIRVDLDNACVELRFFNYCDKDVKVVVDPEQMRRVINNIVTNAIKYNNKSKGILTIRLREQEELVQVEIEDNGRGIAQEDIEHIFDRLYRADSSRNSKTGGSGLGLSIAKKIVEEHGGSIWAESKEDIGTMIYFTIQKEKPDEKQAIEN